MRDMGQIRQRTRKEANIESVKNTDSTAKTYKMHEVKKLAGFVLFKG